MLFTYIYGTHCTVYLCKMISHKAKLLVLLLAFVQHFTFDVLRLVLKKNINCCFVCFIFEFKSF